MNPIQSFIQQYYTLLLTSGSDISQFYTPESVISRTYLRKNGIGKLSAVQPKNNFCLEQTKIARPENILVSDVSEGKLAITYSFQSASSCYSQTLIIQVEGDKIKILNDLLLPINEFKKEEITPAEPNPDAHVKEQKKAEKAEKSKETKKKQKAKKDSSYIYVAEKDQAPKPAEEPKETKPAEKQKPSQKKAKAEKVNDPETKPKAEKSSKPKSGKKKEDKSEYTYHA